MRGIRGEVAACQGNAPGKPQHPPPGQMRRAVHISLRQVRDSILAGVPGRFNWPASRPTMRPPGELGAHAAHLAMAFMSSPSAISAAPTSPAQRLPP